MGPPRRGGPLAPGPPPSDATVLVRRARGGDREAFGQIYLSHRASVHRLARFYLADGADDAVAETFVRAWKALPRYKETGAPFSAWLYGIARRVVMDELKTRRRTEPRAELPEAAWSDDAHERAAMAEAIANLPKDQRRVIEMKYLIGMRNPEVAAVLNTSVGAVNATQWRALKKLRELVGD